YSIYEKMLNKKLEFSEISDIVGFRLIFEDEEGWLRYYAEISDRLGQRNLASSKDSDMKNEFTPAGIRFLNDSRIVNGFPTEVQYIDAGEYLRYQNSPFGHWNYKAARENADIHQRFNHDPIILTADYPKDFMEICERISKKWVVVFTPHERRVKRAHQYTEDEVERGTYRPVALPAGAIPADFAAHRSVRMFDENYRGIEYATPESVRRVIRGEGSSIEDIRYLASGERHKLQSGLFVRVVTNSKKGKKKGGLNNFILHDAVQCRTKIRFSQITARKKKYKNPQAELKARGVDSNDFTHFFRFYYIRQDIDDVNMLYDGLAYGLIDIEQFVAMCKGSKILENNGIDFIGKENIYRQLKLVIDEKGVSSILELLEILGREGGESGGKKSITLKDVTRILYRQDTQVAISKSGFGKSAIEITTPDENWMSFVHIMSTLKELGISYSLDGVRVKRDDDNKVQYRIPIVDILTPKTVEKLESKLLQPTAYFSEWSSKDEQKRKEFILELIVSDAYVLEEVIGQLSLISPLLVNLESVPFQEGGEREGVYTYVSIEILLSDQKTAKDVKEYLEREIPILKDSAKAVLEVNSINNGLYDEAVLKSA
ncbi:hypothetical protein ACFL3D_06230, partial [Candidatus Omnitrophota bacterium]